MNLIRLDEMIMYIENNLKENIELRKLSGIVGLPPYILKRVFNFITGITISEYIRKRRLSKAYEDIKNDCSITSTAFIYGYSSSSAFCRAFKKYFGILPSDVKNKKEFACYPKIIFDKNIIDIDSFKYQIIDMENLTLYGKKCEIDDEHYTGQIYNLYCDLKKDGLLDTLKNGIWYGATIIENNKEYYFVGSSEYHQNLEKVKLPKSRYIIFDSVSSNQNDIASSEIKVHNSYLPATDNKRINFNLYELEIYNMNDCNIAIPID